MPDYTTVNPLQIKIEQAKSQLSDDTLNAIAAVNWKMAILEMRERRGFTFEQLGDLEIETELVLCGLLRPEDYPKELKKRMDISEAAANDLVSEMNEKVFSRIKEELIKITERKKIFAKKITEEAHNTQVLKDHGIEIVPGGYTTNPKIENNPTVPNQEIKKDSETLPIAEKLEIPSTEKPKQDIGDILSKKLSTPSQIPSTQTEHSLDNITKTVTPASYPPKADPYRLPPE